MKTTIKNLKFLSVGSLTLLCCLLRTSPSFSQQEDAAVEKVPDPEQWAREVEKDKTREYAYPHRFVFVDESEGKAPRFLEFGLEAFNALGIHKAVQSIDLAWSWQLNDFFVRKWQHWDTKEALSKFENPTNEKDKLLSLNNLLLVFGVDMFVHAPSNPTEPWTVFKLSGDHPIVAAQLKGPPSFAVEDLYRWISTALGYDGLVLDRRGEYYLVAAATSYLRKPDLQALALKSSHNKLYIKAGERSGTALLSMVRKSGYFGVFKVTFFGQGINEIPINTKVILEQTNFKKSNSNFDIKPSTSE